MDIKNVFAKFYKRLSKEALLKSLIFGGCIALGANFAAALLTWFFGIDGLWISIGVFAAVFAAATALLYFFKFRPSVKGVARRLDEMGLEERLITMTELQYNDSLIAAKQREDAKQKLGFLNAKNIKYVVSTASIVVAAVMLAAGGAMTTVSALSARGHIDPGIEIIKPIFDPEVFYTVRYEVMGEGEIDGEIDQLVLAGGDATPVMAVAEEGWAFICWSDGAEDPYRQDLAVSPDGEFSEVDEDGNVIITYHAVFMELDEQEGDSPDDSGGDEQKEQDGAEDQPSEGEEGEQKEEQKPQDGDDGTSGDGKGGEYADQNQVIDGDQYYGDRYDEYLELAKQILDQGGELPQELKDYIEMYYKTIE